MISSRANRKRWRRRYAPLSKRRKRYAPILRLRAIVGLGKFPADAAELIAGVVTRDAEFYDPAISEERIAKMNRFAASVGQLTAPVKYEDVVAVRYRELWR